MAQNVDIPDGLRRAVNESRKTWDERGEAYPEHLLAAIVQVEGIEVPDGFRLTGYYRIPNIGEWYLYNQGCAAIMDGPATNSSVWILAKEENASRCEYCDGVDCEPDEYDDMWDKAGE